MFPSFLPLSGDIFNVLWVVRKRSPFFPSFFMYAARMELGYYPVFLGRKKNWFVDRWSREKEAVCYQIMAPEEKREGFCLSNCLERFLLAKAA